MKNVLTNLMASAVLLFTIGSGLEAQTIQLHAAVPFAWHVNGRQMQAGNYEISRDASSPVLLIQDRTNGRGAYVMTIPETTGNSASRLVFHRYGNRYFLAEVVAPGVTVGTLPISRDEKEAMKSERPREVATVFVDIRAGN
jgi:hypothetical protein